MTDSKVMKKFTFRLDREVLKEMEENVESDNHEAVSKSQIARNALDEYL